MTFKYKGKSLDGIVKYLKSINHLDDVISIEVSNVFNNYSKEYIFHDFNSKYNHWVSEDSDDEYVIFTFTTIQPILTHYSIQSHWDDRYFLRSWSLEGSNNKEKWEQLHTQNNSTDLSDFQIKTYKVNNSLRLSYRYYRFKKKGVNEVIDERMRIADVEFFGIFFNLPTCFIIKHIFIKKLFLIILVLI